MLISMEQYFRSRAGDGTERAFTASSGTSRKRHLCVDVVIKEPLSFLHDKHGERLRLAAFTKPNEGLAVVEKRI